MKLVFLVGAVAVTIALLMILNIPEISMEAVVVEESEPGQPVVAMETSLL